MGNRKVKGCRGVGGCQAAAQFAPNKMAESIRCACMSVLRAICCLKNNTATLLYSSHFSFTFRLIREICVGVKVGLVNRGCCLKDARCAFDTTTEPNSSFRI